MDWNAYYAMERLEDMPWFYPTLDPDLCAALTHLTVGCGLALDIGSGPGTQSLALAERGFVVTGIDVSEAAVAAARARAAGSVAQAQFVCGDILEHDLGGEFVLIWDRGTFHNLPIAARSAYVAVVHKLLKPHGILFLKCFSHLEPGTGGPFRLNPHQIHEAFSPCFVIASISSTEFHGPRLPFHKALFCVLRAK